MKKWLPLALTLVSSSAMAQKSAIDDTLDHCMEGASTTSAMTQCYGDANQAWDKELNNQYGKLMKKLSAEPKAKLRTAQRNWLTYRDSWLDAGRSRYRDQGTLGTVSLSAQSVSLVRNQAMLLQSMNNGSCANPDDC